MQENRDGSFGNIMEAEDFFKEINRAEKDWSEVKAFHFGTEEELEEIKTEKNIESRVGELEDQIKSITQKKSDFIIEPTKEEVKQFGNGPMRREMLKSMNIVSGIRNINQN